MFAGGGDGDVLAGAIKAGEPDRVVVTLASVDRVRDVTDCSPEPGTRPKAPNPGVPAGRTARRFARLAAVNPVFVIWATRAGAGAVS